MTEPTKERLQRIREEAAKHDGYYRLPRRYGEPILNKSETDLDYAACEKLVGLGEAVYEGDRLGANGIRFVREPRPEPPPRPVMPLEKALHILAACHTTTDDLTGYRVHTLAISPGLWAFSQEEYVTAWGVVRRYLNLPVDPPEAKP